jgi:hypothetical protein
VTAPNPTEVVVRSRTVRAVGALWLTVGILLLAAGLVLLVDQRRVWVELPLAVPALVLGGALWRAHCVFDAHGVLVDDGLRRMRRLWPTIARVVVLDHWRGAAVTLELADGRVVALLPTFGIPRQRRATLTAELAPLAAPHDVEVLPHPADSQAPLRSRSHTSQ